MSFRSSIACAMLFAAAHASAAPAGAPDPGFAGDGSVTVGFDLDNDSLLDQLQAAVAGPGGVTYLVGLANTTPNPLFPDLGGVAVAVARLTHAGKPDLGYGKLGRVVHADAALAHLVMLDAALDAEGRLLTAGYANDGDMAMAVCRFDGDGGIDTTFGDASTPGCARVTLPGSFDLAHAVLALPDGRIALGGEDGLGRAVVAMRAADGAPDDAFGDGGVRELGHGVVFDLALVDGDIVAVGQRHGGQAHGFFAQLDGDTGAAVPQFGGGVVTFDHGLPGGGEDALVAVSIAPDGDRVAAGWSDDGGVARAVLVRVDAAGERVAGFGVDGVREMVGGDGVDRRWIDDVSAGGATRVFVAGRDVTVVNGHPFTRAIVGRLHADGSNDVVFGNGGTASAVFDQAAHASDVSLVMHGARPLVAATVGASPEPPLTGDFAAARFDHGLVHRRLFVTPSAGAGGSIKPWQPVAVAHSNVAAFHVLPWPGFVVAGVSGCGGAFVGGLYTTGPVTADCEVSATFVPAP